jgi:hydroxyacylglutathione hydrolase
LALLAELSKSHDPETPLVTTLSLERQINPFLRLTSKTLIHKLRDRFPAVPNNPSSKEVFLRLRELRDHW